MKYIDTLETALKNNIDILDLLVADEVKSATELIGEDFEKGCELVKSAYMNNDVNISVNNYAWSLKTLIDDGNELDDIDEWMLQEQARKLEY